MLHTVANFTILTLYGVEMLYDLIIYYYGMNPVCQAVEYADDY